MSDSTGHDEEQALWDEVLQERNGGEADPLADLGDPIDDASASSPEPTSTPDWQAEAEQMRQKYAQLEHEAKSDRGRVSALTKQNAELKALIEQAGQGNDDQPTKRETTAALASPEKWAEYEENWPDEAEAIKSYLAQERQQIRQDIFNEVSPYLNYIQQISQQSAQEQFFSALADEDHQDWQDVWQSKPFAEWFNSQPEQVKALHQSSNPQDIHWLIDTYKQAHGVNTQTASQIQRQRQQRLRGAEAVNGARIPKAGAAPQDEDALWEWTARQREAKKQQGRHA
jgi:thiaminase